jgi:hypothetical protein
VALGARPGVLNFFVVRPNVVVCCNFHFCIKDKVGVNSVYTDSSGMVMVPVGEVVQLGSFDLSGLIGLLGPKVLEPPFI